MRTDSESDLYKNQVPHIVVDGLIPPRSVLDKYVDEDIPGQDPFNFDSRLTYLNFKYLNVTPIKNPHKESHPLCAAMMAPFHRGITTTVTIVNSNEAEVEIFHNDPELTLKF